MTGSAMTALTARRWLGGLLMAAGGLIAVTVGLCSVVFLIMALRESGLDKELLTEGLPFVLVVGGIPTVVGLALFFIGRRLYRNRADGEPPGTA